MFDIKIEYTPPDKCPGCGVETKDIKKEHPEGLLMFPIPNAGVCHFICPVCFTVMMNKDCFENQAKIRKKIKAEEQSRIIRPNMPMGMPSKIIQ